MSFFSDSSNNNVILMYVCYINSAPRIEQHNSWLSFLIFKPIRCIKSSFCISEELPNFLQPKGFGKAIFMELFNNRNLDFFHLSSTASHLYLQVKNCNSNSHVVMDEDDNRKFVLEKSYALSTKRFLKHEQRNIS